MLSRRKFTFATDFCSALHSNSALKNGKHAANEPMEKSHSFNVSNPINQISTFARVTVRAAPTAGECPPASVYSSPTGAA